MARTSSRSAPASISEPSAMSPAMPEKQWNQARVVIAASLEHPQHGARRAVAVVDADHREACGARREHRQERRDPREAGPVADARGRSEEHTSELQSLMRISYAVFCLKKKK